MSKHKGSNAERELVKWFWAIGWAALRTAGSGSMHFPAPDILAGNKIRRIAIEVKATKHLHKYFPKEEIKQLQNFASYFGAEPWIAVKFSTVWVFANPEDLDTTQRAFVLRKTSHFGLTFEDITQS